jgi:hypothetical protein
VSDSLYFSLWFPSFSGPEMLPHVLSLLQMFPFSEQRPGISYLAMHPVSWNEATILERRIPAGLSPEDATLIMADFIHDDYAYVFEAYWDLWIPNTATQQWELAATPVRLIVQGEEFDDRAYEQTGHIQVDFGLDGPFLQEEVELTEETQAKVRDNVRKLVEFTTKVEKNSRASGRLLWSDSDDNLARKLVARLQRVQ